MCQKHLANYLVYGNKNMDQTLMYKQNMKHIKCPHLNLR